MISAAFAFIAANAHALARLMRISRHRLSYVFQL